MFLVRVIGYFVAMAAVDIAVDYLEVRKMKREMTRFTNDSDGEVSAHVVTEETAGPVMTVGGTSRDVAPGDVLIGTDRPDVYHVAGSDALDGYVEADGDSGDDSALTALTVEDAAQPTDDSESDQDFNPDDHNATEVRTYLRRMRDAGNRAEYDRVTEAERAGHNRASALDGDYDR